MCTYITCIYRANIPCHPRLRHTVTCCFCTWITSRWSFSLADSRTPILRCVDEPVAQKTHSLRQHRLPVRRAAGHHHHAGGLLARGTLPHARPPLPAARVRREQPTAAAVGQHLEERLPRDLRLGVRQLCPWIYWRRLLCDQARRMELQDLQWVPGWVTVVRSILNTISNWHSCFW